MFQHINVVKASCFFVFEFVYLITFLLTFYFFFYSLNICKYLSTISSTYFVSTWVRVENICPLFQHIDTTEKRNHSEWCFKCDMSWTCVATLNENINIIGLWTNFNKMIDRCNDLLKTLARRSFSNYTADRVSCLLEIFRWLAWTLKQTRNLFYLRT